MAVTSASCEARQPIPLQRGDGAVRQLVQSQYRALGPSDLRLFRFLRSALPIYCQQISQVAPLPTATSATMDPVTAPRYIGHLALVLAVTDDGPHVSGALCAGQAPSFDATGIHVKKLRAAPPAAVATCRRCPALAACRAWVARQVPGTLDGI